VGVEVPLLPGGKADFRPVVSDWLRARCVLDRAAQCRTLHAYKDFLRWRAEQQIPAWPVREKFLSALESLGARRHEDAAGRLVLRGFALRTPPVSRPRYVNHDGPYWSGQVFEAFWSQCVTPRLGGVVTIAELYERFCGWARSRNRPPSTYTEKLLARWLIAHGVVRCRLAGGRRAYSGIALIQQEQANTTPACPIAAAPEAAASDGWVE
jgi:hypothetical protein